MSAPRLSEKAGSKGLDRARERKRGQRTVNQEAPTFGIDGPVGLISLFLPI